MVAFFRVADAPWPIGRLAIAHLGALDQEEQRQVKDLDDGCTWAEIGFQSWKFVESDGI